MPKLKALRGAVGSYGRVAAGGIVEVDESAADKLIKTGRFVRASAADIEAAQKAQKAALATAVPGAGKGFMPMPEKGKGLDRLEQMVERGEITQEKARELVSLQISLSTDEVRAFIEKEGKALDERLAKAAADLDKRAEELDQREQALDAREKALVFVEAKAATETKAKTEAKTEKAAK